MAYSDLILGNSPSAYYRLGEASGTTAADSSGNALDGTYVGSPTLGAPGLLAADEDTAVTFDGASQKVSLPSMFAASPAAITVHAIIKRGTPTGNFELISSLEQGAAFFLWMDSSNGKISGSAVMVPSVFSGVVASTTALAVGDEAHVVLEWVKGSRLSLYVNGFLNDEITGLADSFLESRTSGNFIAAGPTDSWYSGTVDELAVFEAPLGPTAITGLADAWQGITAAQSIPLTLSGHVDTAAQSIPLTLSGHLDTPAQSIPLRLLGETLTPAQSIPLTLHSVDEADATGPAVRWRVAVTLGGVDLSDSLSGPVHFNHQEASSGSASLAFLPAAGAIAPEQYENKPVTIDWVLLNSNGSDRAPWRMFTGVVELAEYDPDAGEVTISATNDRQGRLENTSRAAIATQVGGLWTRHVFDDTADGYQYAEDRISTQAADLVVSPFGGLVVHPWAAKSVADITITDDGRFAGTVRLQRATRRDLVTRYTINMDFRFVRLRHREVAFKLVDIDFCSYLQNNFPLPSKGMVQSAAEGSEWTQIGGITFTEVPLTGTYCGGLNWLNTDADDDYCLGASWKAARRWAQTVTEQYLLEVTAPDLAESVGELVTSADYGIEATYDASEYERNTNFDGPPVGATIDPALADYVYEATDAEQSGRAAMEEAQQCALAVARSEILGRARRTSLAMSCEFHPDIDLSRTVHFDTTYLQAKGKVREVDGVMDPSSAELGMTVTLALSRHGGSGVASDTPLDPSARPDMTTETPTDRVHALGLRLGMTASSPPDTGTVDGYYANVASNGNDYDANGVSYQRRLAVIYPQIEEAARQAVAAPITTAYTVAVPQDLLTMEA